MHAVLVTFQSTLSLEDVESAFTDHARSLETMPELVCATWISAGARLGSYQVFADRWAAEQYLGGNLFSQVKTNPAFTDFEIRHFEVVDSLSHFAETTRLTPQS